MKKLKTYKQLNSFHKYWGKKSLEHYEYLIDNFSKKNDIILEPFLGSGLVTKLVLEKDRRFIGIDINPISIEMANLFIDLPQVDEFLKAFTLIEKKVKEKIENTYKTNQDFVATHYLWEDKKLIEVWHKKDRTSVSKKPTTYDLRLIDSFKNKKFTKYNLIPFYKNSRIGVSEKDNINSFFTKRALLNIKTLLNEIDKLEPQLKRCFQLVLSSNLGQMSNMVFAIKRRGSLKNKNLSKYEVGSWAIGLWRPKLHFEINVWNCFEIRVKKFIKTLGSEPPTRNYKISKTINLKSKDDLFLKSANSLSEIKKLKDNSIDLLITDPPHSDRVPYLELSAIWNNILGYQNVDFENEIIFSNSSEREKTSENYKNDITIFLKEALRVTKQNGLIGIMFNSSNPEDWTIFDEIKSNFIGMYDTDYSVGSIVQDNRANSLKEDKMLIFSKDKLTVKKLNLLKKCKNWTTSFPTN